MQQNIKELLDALCSPFPEAQISWRAQSVSKTGDKALALCYIDARDVMNRLDSAVGPENWSDNYLETVKGRVLCALSIKIDGQWVTKTDGAGDSDVEAEKGAISDAFKRAAVKWGIGRYLYDLPSPWVPCESYDKNGKFYWSKWKESPWNYVRKQAPTAPKKPVPAFETDDLRDKFKANVIKSYESALTIAELKQRGTLNKAKTDLMKVGTPKDVATYKEIQDAYASRRDAIKNTLKSQSETQPEETQGLQY